MSPLAPETLEKSLRSVPQIPAPPALPINHQTVLRLFRHSRADLSWNAGILKSSICLQAGKIHTLSVSHIPSQIHNRNCIPPRTSRNCTARRCFVMFSKLSRQQYFASPRGKTNLRSKSHGKDNNNTSRPLQTWPSNRSSHTSIVSSSHHIARYIISRLDLPHDPNIQRSIASFLDVQPRSAYSYNCIQSLQ